MHDVHVVEDFESSNALNEDSPNLVFVYCLVHFLVVFYHLENVAPVSIFHHNAKIVSHLMSKNAFSSLPEHATGLVEKRFFVPDHVNVVY